MKVTIILITLILLSKLILHHSKDALQENMQCALVECNLLFDNPIEKLIIQKTIVTKVEKNTCYLSVYTLGCIKYATAEIVYNEKAIVTWRLLF